MASRSPRRASTAPTRGVTTMPFDPSNYRLLLGAVGLIVLGYALMLADNALNGAAAVDSALSLVVAPLLLLGGYVGVAAAVLWGVPREAEPERAADVAEAA